MWRRRCWGLFIVMGFLGELLLGRALIKKPDQLLVRVALLSALLKLAAQNYLVAITKV